MSNANVLVVDGVTVTSSDQASIDDVLAGFVKIQIQGIDPVFELSEDSSNNRREKWIKEVLALAGELQAAATKAGLWK